MKFKIVIFCIGILLGIVVGFIIINASNACIDYNYKVALLEYVYYIGQLFGVLATTMAVIVAIWGKEIKDAIFKPKCTLFLDNDGFKECLGDTEGTASPKASYYESLLCIKNTGKEIGECALFINNITYKSNEKQKKPKTLLKDAHNNLYWGNKRDKWIGLITDDTRSVPLFRIYPQSANQTPDGCTTSPMRMNIMGFSISDSKYVTNGVWEISYTFQTKERVLKRFNLTISWDGEWFDREQEMSNCLDVKLKML